MNVLKFLAKADPLPRKLPLQIELADLGIDFNSDFVQSEINPTTSPNRVRRLSLVAAVVVLLAWGGVIAPDSPNVDSQNQNPIDWSAPTISPAAATVQIAEKAQQFTRIKAGQTLFLMRKASRFSSDGTLVDRSFTKSWTSTNLENASYLLHVVKSKVVVPKRQQQWSETSRMPALEAAELSNFANVFSPVWERTVPYENTEAMYRKLVIQSKVFNSVLSSQEWLLSAISSLVNSETAAPAQLIMAIAISNSLFDQGIVEQKWVQTKQSGRVIWVRYSKTETILRLEAINPQIPGIAASARYSIDQLNRRTLIEEYSVETWAIVSGIDAPVMLLTSGSNNNQPKIDLSKL